MIDEKAWELIPPNIPDDIPLWIEPALDQANIRDDQSRRAYTWAQHLLNQFRDGPALGTVLSGGIYHTHQPRIEDISAGFIPFRESDVGPNPGSRELYLSGHPSVPTVVADDITYTFGLVIGVSLASPVGEDIGFNSEPDAFITLDGEFPAVLERREILEDAPSNPMGNATSACYAKPRQNKKYFCGVSWNKGILIARHVLKGVGTTAGVAVPMQGNWTTTIVDIDSATTIDAAIVDAGSRGIPKTANRLNVSGVTPIGGRTTIHGNNVPFQADILRVMDDSKYYGNIVAHRVFVDKFGSRGDSGGLVTLDSSSNAIGLYIGKTNGAQNEGIVQSMRQVCEYFEIDLEV